MRDQATFRVYKPTDHPFCQALAAFPVGEQGGLSLSVNPVHSAPNWRMLELADCGGELGYAKIEEKFRDGRRVWYIGRVDVREQLRGTSNYHRLLLRLI